MDPMTTLFIAIAVLVLAVVIGSFVLLFRPWLQCFMSGAAVSAFEIVGMRMRRAPVQLICEQRIRANYVGVQLPTAELEKAHLQGVDITKAVDALCLAKQTGVEADWEDLVAVRQPFQADKSHSPPTRER